MKIYLIMQYNGYGNSVVNSTWATKVEAEAECKRLQTSQERYDNHYYVIEKELQGERSGNKSREFIEQRQAKSNICLE